nr:MAG TPA: hypothetical protein [Caudoviricetes sp.]
MSSLTSSSGLRCPFRRGHANNGANAGLAYLNGNNAVSNANVNWSSPLTCRTRIFYMKWRRDLVT